MRECRANTQVQERASVCAHTRTRARTHTLTYTHALNTPHTLPRQHPVQAKALGGHISREPQRLEPVHHDENGLVLVRDGVSVTAQSLAP